MKVHGAWLASSVNCCFPTRLPDQPGVEEKDRDLRRDLDEEYEVAQSADTSRRNSPLPISSAISPWKVWTLLICDRV